MIDLINFRCFTHRLLLNFISLHISNGSVSALLVKHVLYLTDLMSAKCIPYVTNFIWSYLHHFFNDSHGLKASLKPLKRPFDRCQSRLEAINNGRDIKQINW